MGLSNKVLLAIQKAIDTGTLTGAGLLNAEDALKFIQDLVDQSQFLSKIRSEKMTSESKNIDVMTVAARQLRKHSEGIDPGFRAAVSASRNVLTAVKCMLPVEITADVLELNIEGEGLEDTIRMMMTMAYGNDLADLAINGDEGSADPFLNINDGYVVLAKANGASYDTNASTDWVANFGGALDLMPNRFKANKSAIVFMVSPNDEQAYRDTLATRETAMGDAYLVSDKTTTYQGIAVEPNEYLPDGTFLLSRYDNLVFGIHFGIKIKSDEDIFADTNQFAITTRNDFNFAVNEAVVVGYDVP